MSSHAHAHSHDHGHRKRGPSWPAPELAGIVAMLGDDRGRVVDIGCGAGSDAIYLAERGFDVVGIDLDEVAIAEASERSNERNVNVRWLVGSALELPLEDGSVTAAFDRGCLHHVPVEDHPTYMAELARVLEPGGRAFLRDLSGHGHHPTPVTPEGVHELVEGVPLDVVAAIPFQMMSQHPPDSATLAVLRRTDA